MIWLAVAGGQPTKGSYTAHRMFSGLPVVLFCVTFCICIHLYSGPGESNRQNASVAAHRFPFPHTAPLRRVVGMAPWWEKFRPADVASVSVDARNKIALSWAGVQYPSLIRLALWTLMRIATLCVYFICIHLWPFVRCLISIHYILFHGKNIKL